jgi:hypothetical protein
MPYYNELQKKKKEHNDDKYKNLNQFNDADIGDAIGTLTGNKLNMEDNTKSSKYNNIDDPIIEEMQRQSKV